MKSSIRGFPESDESLLWTNGTGSSVASGALVQIGGASGDNWGIAAVTIANGGVGTVNITGEYSLTKTSGYTLAQGQAWTWDGTKVIAWTPASATPRGGTVTEAAGTDDLTAKCRLEPNRGPRVFATAFTVTSIEAAANSNNGRVDFVTGFGAAPAAVSVMVLTASTGVAKSGFVVSFPAAGTVRVDGVAAGVQVDANDVVHITAIKAA